MVCAHRSRLDFDGSLSEITRTKMRYFKTDNATLPVKLPSRYAEWSIVGFVGGSAQGILALKHAEAEAFISRLPKGVSEISLDEYNRLIKKKIPKGGTQIFTISNLPGPPQPQPHRAVPVAEVKQFVEDPVRLRKVQT